MIYKGLLLFSAKNLSLHISKKKKPSEERISFPKNRVKETSTFNKSRNENPEQVPILQNKRGMNCKMN